MRRCEMADERDVPKPYTLISGQTFATKEDLAYSLLRKEKWKNPRGGIREFKEDSKEESPFICTYNNMRYAMDDEWDECDGKTIWTRVEGT
jgi:hypothetical protein